MLNPRLLGDSGEYETIVLTAHGALAKNDFVTLQADGQAEATAAGEPIFGIVIDAATGAADTFLAIRAKKGMKVLMDNDNVGTTFAATHIGGRFDITGASANQLADTSTVAQVGDGTDTGQLLCVGFSPDGYGFDGDASIGIFELAEVQ